MTHLPVGKSSQVVVFFFKKKHPKRIISGRNPRTRLASLSHSHSPSLQRNTREAQALSTARVHSTRRSLWPCRRPLCYWLRGTRFPPLESGHWLPRCNQSRPHNLASPSRVRLHSLDFMLVCAYNVYTVCVCVCHSYTRKEKEMCQD